MPLPTLGTEAPAFALPTYEPATGTVGQVRSQQLRGKWVVLAFYPADFTFVCPTELADLAAHHQAIRQLGGEVVVASTDSVYTHKAWLETEKLLYDVRYPMGADHNGAVAKAYGVYDEATGEAQRGTFVLDPDGVLKAVVLSADPVGRSAKELVRVLRALVFTRAHPGQVCPANWDEGKPIIKKSLAASGRVYEQVKA